MASGDSWDALLNSKVNSGNNIGSYSASGLTPTTGTAPQIFASALQFFAASQCLISEDIIPDTDVRNFEKFHFIIVGAGTAGCVLANRISAVKEWNVLLIEAGDDAPVEAKIPGLDQSMLGTKYDWKYLTSFDGLTNEASDNNSINWPRGKMIGGCSNLNAMIYVQGNDHDYQNWFEAGNVEWNAKEVRRCFRKAESFQDMKAINNPEINKHYGHDGPLVINSFNSSFRLISDKVLSAWNEIGIKNVPDLNVANVLGSGIKRVTAANGERQSHNKAYLNPILHRKNLKIIKNSLVTKVLFKHNSKIAHGVEVERGLEKYTFYATNEIIISAGAINSPQLLMLSGVGPKRHLCSKNISVIVDSPMVGQNLQDHCLVPVTIYGNEPNEPNEDKKHFDEIMYLYNRTGYLAQNIIGDILAFYSEHKNATFPDFQSHILFIWKNDTAIQKRLSTIFRYKDRLVNSIIELNKKYTIYIHLFNLLHPYSRGNISLFSNNPRDHPVIYANYFSDARDLESAVTGIKILTKVVNTTSFKAIGAFLGRMEWPPCDVYELDSRDYWKCVCINMVQTIYHPVGTCKMGPDPDTSVVDSRLRVHGVTNLRVIDASIMPTITSGNTNGPTTIIAERGVELLLEDYKKT